MNNPPRDRRSSCEGKHRFPTWSAAEAVRRLIARGHDAGPMHAYACRFCGGFHLGNAVHKSSSEQRHA